MTVEINDIVTIKLTNGDEIVGQLVKHSDAGVHLAQPMKLGNLSDANSLLTAFVSGANTSLQSAIGQSQDMMSTVASSGLSDAHAQISDIVTNMPSSATMISKAGEINTAIGQPPPPSLDSIFDPIVNGGLNNALSPVMDSMNGINTAVNTTITDSINAMIDQVQGVFNTVGMVRATHFFSPVLASASDDMVFRHTSLISHPVKTHDEVVRDYLVARQMS